MQLNRAGIDIRQTYNHTLNDSHDQTLMTRIDDHATSTTTDLPCHSKLLTTALYAWLNSSFSPWRWLSW